MDTFTENIRKHIVETLELIASKQEQIEYQEKVPYINVANELFNQWDDWYYPENSQFQRAFSITELEHLAHFHKMLEQIAENTPHPLLLVSFIDTVQWNELANAAQIALEMFE